MADVVPFVVAVVDGLDNEMTSVVATMIDVVYVWHDSVVCKMAVVSRGCLSVLVWRCNLLLMSL